MKVWVLLMERNGDTTVKAVYAGREALEAGIKRIAKANAQYEMRRLSPNSWRIGPDEDEGFFGHKPVYLTAVEAGVRD